MLAGIDDDSCASWASIRTATGGYHSATNEPMTGFTMTSGSLSAQNTQLYTPLGWTTHAPTTSSLGTTCVIFGGTPHPGSSQSQGVDCVDQSASSGTKLLDCGIGKTIQMQKVTNKGCSAYLELGTPGGSQAFFGIPSGSYDRDNCGRMCRKFWKFTFVDTTTGVTNKIWGGPTSYFVLSSNGKCYCPFGTPNTDPCTQATETPYNIPEIDGGTVTGEVFELKDQPPASTSSDEDDFMSGDGPIIIGAAAGGLVLIIILIVCCCCCCKSSKPQQTMVQPMQQQPMQQQYAPAPQQVPYGGAQPMMAPQQPVVQQQPMMQQQPVMQQPQPVAQPAPVAAAPAGGGDTTAKIMALKNMRDAGAISEGDFQAKKAAILSGM